MLRPFDGAHNISHLVASVSITSHIWFKGKFSTNKELLFWLFNVQSLVLPVGSTPTSLQDSIVIAWVAKAVSEAEGHHTKCVEYLASSFSKTIPHLFG